MRFSAKITTEEERFDDDSSEAICSFQITTGYEMESIQQTINLRPKNRRASSVPTFKRKSGLSFLLSAFFSASFHECIYILYVIALSQNERLLTLRHDSVLALPRKNTNRYFHILFVAVVFIVT